VSPTGVGGRSGVAVPEGPMKGISGIAGVEQARTGNISRKNKQGIAQTWLFILLEGLSLLMCFILPKRQPAATGSSLHKTFDRNDQVRNPFSIF
jgi:hypothetical protein